MRESKGSKLSFEKNTLTITKSLGQMPKVPSSRCLRNWSILTKTKDQLQLQELGFALSFKTMFFSIKCRQPFFELWDVFEQTNEKKIYSPLRLLPYLTVNSVGRTKMHTSLKEQFGSCFLSLLLICKVRTVRAEPIWFSWSLAVRTRCGRVALS